MSMLSMALVLLRTVIVDKNSIFLSTVDFYCEISIFCLIIAVLTYAAGVISFCHHKSAVSPYFTVELQAMYACNGNY